MRLASLILGTLMVGSLATPALASHVGTVEVTPPLGIETVGICSPFLVTTSGGSDPVGAVVDVEVRGVTPVEFCLPAVGLNPVLIDPATGDLGNGPVEIDGTIGGEATTAASAVIGQGEFTFGISSPSVGSYDIDVFVEEPGGPDDNDDPDAGEPIDTATQFVVLPNGGSNGGEVPGATELVTSLDCVPEEATNPSGSAHDFFCRATGVAGAAIPGAEVSFNVTDGPNAAEVSATQCGYTAATGIVSCSYTDATGSDSPAGTDTIVGFTGSDQLTSVNQDTILATFSAAGGGANKVASAITIARRFKGRVKSAVGKCERRRKVVLKKVRKGRDKTVGRDRSNRSGRYRIRKSDAKGRYYTKVKKARKSSVVCLGDKSKTVRRS